MDLAKALFSPRAVALVGASGDAAKTTARPQRYLKKHGYGGKVFPVNPTRDEVLGEKAYRRVSEVPEAVDHAYILIENVEEALEDCGRRGVAVASIFSGGFADAGAQGMQRQGRLVERARALGVRLLGPNSMAVINVTERIALSVNAVLEMDALPAGTTSIVSQSGTMLGTLLSRGAARGLGFDKLVSVGNEADIGVGELVELLAEDPRTRVITLFLETVRDAERLAAAARKAHAAGRRSWPTSSAARRSARRPRARIPERSPAPTLPLTPFSATAASSVSTCSKPCWRSRPWLLQECL